MKPTSPACKYFNRSASKISKYTSHFFSFWYIFYYLDNKNILPFFMTKYSIRIQIEKKRSNDFFVQAVYILNFLWRTFFIVILIKMFQFWYWNSAKKIPCPFNYFVCKYFFFCKFRYKIEFTVPANIVNHTISVINL